MLDERAEVAAEAARGLAEGDRLLVVRAARSAGHAKPPRARSPIGWPNLILVTVQAATDEGLDVVVDIVPVRRWGGVAVEAPPGSSERVPLVARIAYGTIRTIDPSGEGPYGAPCLEAAYGRLKGPFTAWRAGGTPVTGFLPLGVWGGWPQQVRQGWRRRRELWTELLTIGPFDERVATGLVRYLKDPTQETRTELIAGVSHLLDELLHPGPGYASPRLFAVTRTRFEVTSPTSVRIVGYGVIDVRDTEQYRLRPCMADLARPPATSTLRLAGKEDEIDEPANMLAPPSVRPGAVAWRHTFEVRLRETWKTRVLPLLAPEGPPSAGERVARALVAYLDRPTQYAADEVAEHLYKLGFAGDGYCFEEDALTLDGPFEITKVEVLSRTAIRLTGEAMTLDDDADTCEFPVVVELALPPATSTIQIDADKRHVATFVLPPPPD